MEYHIDEIEDGREITLIGSFTYRDHEVFEKIIALIKNLAGKNLVFNLSQVDFIDSAILGMFVIASDEASRGNVTIYLKGATGIVREVMEESLFDRIFNFC